jgi:hypothetical protein
MNNHVIVNLTALGYDWKKFDCLDYEEIAENVQNFSIYPDPLDVYDVKSNQEPMI